MSRPAFFALAALLTLASATFAPARAQGDGQDHTGHNHPPGQGHDATPHAPAQPTAPSGPKRLKPVLAEGFTLLPGLWQARQESLRAVTLPALIDACEASGRVANFHPVASGAKEHRGGAGADADVYMTIEAIAHALITAKDPGLEARVDAWIDVIAGAQAGDGYLNTFVQSTGAAGRFVNAESGQELATAGRLFEAAVAYRRATGKTKLLDVARKFADHLDATFGPGKKSDPSAHPGVEVGLASLYEATGEARYLALARFFVEQRGKSEGRTSHGDVAQDRRPLREQNEVTGDPERAARLYAGAADVARLANDDTLITPLQGLFQDLTRYKLHVTGGVATGADGMISNLTAPQSESRPSSVSASIAVAEWAHRMFLLTSDARYADVVDHATNNVILGALTPKGDALFGALPLHAAGERARRPIADELTTAANVARFVSSVADRTFALGGNTIYAAQYVSCVGDVTVADVPIRVKMQSDWPFAGRVSFDLNPAATLTFALKLRRPQWCKMVVYQHDLKEQEHSSEFPGTEAGWEPYERKYEPIDGARAHFLSPARRVPAPESVAAWQGRVAVLRGPLVYALEGVDNRGSAGAIVIPADASLSAWDKPDATLGSIRVFKGKGALVENGPGGVTTRKTDVILIPYFLAANRGASDVVVWLPETPVGATPKAN